MTDKWQNRIDKIHEISGWCIAGTVILFLVAAFFKPGNWFLWANGVLFCTALLTNFISGHWATDEEKKERKQEIKEALREMEEEKPSEAKTEQFNGISPLTDVTKEQEQKIIQLLNKVARSTDGTNKMKRSEVATFLATLKAMNHLEDGGDYNNLRLWVQEVTGTEDSDKAHFNEQYKRALGKIGETKYTKSLDAIFLI